jgi:hypothetical protein
MQRSTRRRIERIERFVQQHFMTLEELLLLVGCLRLAVHRCCDPETAARIDADFDTILARFGGSGGGDHANRESQAH